MANQGSGKSTVPAVDSAGNHLETEKLRRELEMLKMIFDSIYNGAVVTDAGGTITHFNAPYGKFLGVDPAAQIGRHVTKVIENTRMHVVTRTGKPEINDTQRIMGQRMVVQRIPIIQNGEVIGAFGQVMFKDVRDVGKLARKLSLLESKVKFYEEELISLRSTRYTLDHIIGVSAVIGALKEEARQAATTPLPVLITGESGTGKELFAQAIHHESARRLRPFIRINCAAIPRELMESELFGYEKGAFTGAKSSGKPGKFELAHHGSIFLDEIGDLPLEMQPKLLRVLEEKEFERIGGTRLIKADFRVIAASNRKLEEMVADRSFRRDLYYRLNVIPIHLPPLHERTEDILPLARHLVDRIAEELSLKEVTLDRAAEKALKQYPWPGNARELSNVLERTLASLEGTRICLEDLPFHLQKHGHRQQPNNRALLKDIHAQTEKEAIRAALETTGYNKSHAAKLLGIHRTLLYKKIKKYGLGLLPGVKD